MGMLRNLLKTRATEFYLVVFMLWLLPALILLTLGLVYLWQAGWLWWFSGGIFLLSTASLIVRYSLSRTDEEIEAEIEHLAPRPDWSGHDTQVWHQAVANIESANLVETPWEETPRAMLDQLVFVARTYHGDSSDAEYAFSLPELLLMLETWSRDYRAQVIETVPLVQEVKISTLMGLSKKADNFQKAYKYASPLIRVLKIGINPTTGVMSEVTSQVATKIFGDLSLHMQRNMKVILFEQVTQVAIDLYSGRLKLSEEELMAMRGSQLNPALEEIKPLSVIIVGQINAGKSSLINALKQQCVAEIDPLPATAGFHYHPMKLSDDLDVYLIDTPGLDGQADTSKALLKEALKADLLLWVSQANQPAKALDKQLILQWDAYFEENLQRRKPPILLVTTHNDSLPPAGDWHPPYELNDSNSKKVASMKEALSYTHKSMGLPDESLSIPVSLLPGDASYNIDALHDLLLLISSEARAAQLNRQRLDAHERASVVLKGLQQSASLLKLGVHLALK